MTKLLSRGARILRFSLVRIVLAVFVTALAGGLTQAIVGSMADHRFQLVWPELCGVLASLAAYSLYVRWVERRRVTELSATGAVMELGSGLLGGAAMVCAVIASLVLIGAYRLESVSVPSLATGVGFAQMAFVGVFEELLSRAIVFRLLERSLGTWPALVLSSLLFGLAHVPGDTAGAMSVGVAVIAGAFFAAAYLATRRLWLCIGLHIGWNFTLGHVFAMAVSGRPGAGILVGQLSGPDWITGGPYGLEASVFTLLALLLVGAWLLRVAASRGHLPGRRRSSSGELAPRSAGP